MSELQQIAFQQEVCACGHKRIAHFKSWSDSDWRTCCSSGCSCKSFSKQKAPNER